MVFYSYYIVNDYNKSNLKLYCFLPSKYLLTKEWREIRYVIFKKN